ncbi:ABC transporter permease [Fictibacillus aquaticus]|uniref:ABC transporter permease n=1 Tax=Fictibacillus aquaticus TaxID=2021314 RepID=A0A235FF31_9BACL|nr:ABC transporter permease [Fictibacillus aquaticus]OYD59554.1 ABC transporter permease [Fictibacillus aquaticus]
MASKTELWQSRASEKKKELLRPLLKERLQGSWLGLIIPMILLISWEIASVRGVFEAHLLPAPTVVLAKISEMAADGSLWSHIWITLYRVFIGFVIGTASAVVIGSFVGYWKLAENLLDSLVQAFRSIPSLAWVPLFILWMGIGEPSKIVLIAVGVFFPVYLNIVAGIQGVDRKLIEVGKIYQFSSLQIVRRIILPSALPSFITGIRSGLGVGWMFVVAAELMGASEGLGYLLVEGQNTYAPDVVIASILLFALLGKGSDSVLKLVETKALHYQDTLANQG